MIDSFTVGLIYIQEYLKIIATKLEGSLYLTGLKTEERLFSINNS